MAHLSKIHRKAAGGGNSALNGAERCEYDPVAAAVGSLAEANAAVGIARLYTAAMPLLDAALLQFQRDLFVLGEDLAVPFTPQTEGLALRIDEQSIVCLKRHIAAFNAELAPPPPFTLPGGTAAAAHLHMARIIAQRAERHIFSLPASGELNPALLLYCDSLSVFLCAAARLANIEGKPKADGVLPRL